MNWPATYVDRKVYSFNYAGLAVFDQWPTAKHVRSVAADPCRLRAPDMFPIRGSATCQSGTTLRSGLDRSLLERDDVAARTPTAGALCRRTVRASRPDRPTVYAHAFEFRAA